MEHICSNLRKPWNKVYFTWKEPWSTILIEKNMENLYSSLFQLKKTMQKSHFKWTKNIAFT